ncbi:WD40 repeat protein [Hamadaea flava]|uniref:NB-ARC domain-containing protein n=1 Tax=Hamadaea flava TaxID=1742688 RepID=A0ABV8LNC6_9ACTN|nr:NB-ARC domain-containing protein [Hamadaea flava]MCP2322907.1 WD40 repeat protein [Hamadaea flava]
MMRAAGHWLIQRAFPLTASVVIGVAAVLWLPIWLDLVGLMIPGRGVRLVLDWVSDLGPIGLAAAVFAETDRWRRSYARRQAMALQPGTQSTVERPDELEAIVAGLVGPAPAGKAATTVGLTTGVHGAGGFGKTTLARMVCADPRIRSRFGEHVTWVTLGRDVAGSGDLAAKVNEVIAQVGPPDVVAASSDAGEAGRQLASVLSQGPPRLLVIDDVWRLRQLEPFLLGAKHCVRLVTTRNQELMVGRGLSVKVDQMTDAQARRLLVGGLTAPLGGPVEDALLAATGRWALLLSLVNRILASAEQTGVRDLSAYASELCARIESRGPAAVDAVGDGARGLDVSDSRQRAEAVQATVTASTELLEPDELARLRELTIFAEDEAIPLDLIGRLWAVGAGLAEMDTRALCRRLAGLGLITLDADDGGRVGMHDVLRDYLRQSMASDELARLHGRLLEIVSAELARIDGEPAWWQLDHQHRYLWDHVVEHVRGASGPAAAEKVATDLRWATARLLRSGAEAPQADLVTAGTPRALRMREVWGHNAHLLAPTKPPASVSDVLLAILAADPDWADQAATLQVGGADRPRLRLRDPFPPAPPGLRFALTGPGTIVYALGIAPDGTWLAAARNRVVRVWDAATGLERAALTNEEHFVTPMQIGPDGRWIAAAYADGSARVWDVASGQPIAVFTGHAARIRDLAVDLGGRWVATCDVDDVLRAWDPLTGRVLLRGTGVTALAALPDGRLAFGRTNGEVRLSAIPTPWQQPALRGHTGGVDQLTVAPDGTWLASVGGDETVRVWDLATATERARITGWESTVRASPDSRTLLLGASLDGGLRSFDALTGEQIRSFPGHRGAVYCITFAPDGSWFVSAGDDGSLRLWASESGRPLGVLRGHSRWVGDVAVGPDGSWLASSSVDGTVRVWDRAAVEPPETEPVYAIASAALSPDGRTAMMGTHFVDAVTVHDTTDLGQSQRDLGRPDALAISGDGRLAVYTKWNKPGLWLATWDGVGYGEPELLDDTAEDGRACFADDHRLALLVDKTSRLRVWDCETRQLVFERPDVAAAAFFPGRRAVFLAATDRTSMAVGLDGTVIGEYGPYAYESTAVAVAPVTEIVAAGDGAGWVWLDLTRAEGRGHLEGFDEAIVAMAFDPAGMLLLAGGRYGLVAVWDVRGRQPLAAFRFADAVLAVSWNADGIVVVTYGGLHRLDFLGTVDPGFANTSTTEPREAGQD